MNKENFKYLLLSVIVILAALYLIKIFNISYPLTLTSITKSSELSVVGEGKVDVVPDTAYVDAGITVNNEPTVISVQQKIDDVNNKIVEALKALGIKKEDIKTGNYSVSPNYSYENQINRISGYNGNVTITIKLTNTDLSAKVIEAVTQAGANQVGGVRFAVDNPDKFRELARDAAISNAKEQAQKLAKQLGITLGKITNIVEESPSQLSPIYGALSAKGMGGGVAAPQIEPGSQTITSVVTLYFEKK